jgi:hypothetical protein
VIVIKTIIMRKRGRESQSKEERIRMSEREGQRIRMRESKIELE